MSEQELFGVKDSVNIVLAALNSATEFAASPDVFWELFGAQLSRLRDTKTIRGYEEA
jgi:hypothetical protein